METLYGILFYLCIGASVALGFIGIIALAVILIKIYEHFFPSQKEININITNQKIMESLRNVIILDKESYPSITNNRSKENNFKTRIKELRREYWQKDLVLPSILIKESLTQDYDLFVKLEGKLLFKGEKESANPEDQIINIINSYYEGKNKSKEISNG